MIKLELTWRDAQEFREMLMGYLSDLRMEIAGTDKKDYREALKARKKILKDVIAQLEERRIEAPPAA